MTYSLIIWDFNGTVLDDVDTGIKSVNTLLARRGLPLIETKEQYRSIFGFPIIGYYRRLGFDFEKESYDLLAHEWVAEYLKNEKSAGLRPCVKEALKAVKSAGIKQIILSASESEMLSEQCKRLEITDYFDGIFGTEDIYAYGKTEIAKKYMREYGIGSAVLIGDTIHDADTAAAIGADCFLLSGGHQSDEVLKRPGVPVILPEDIIKRILG